jgi:hypothetical protein
MKLSYILSMMHDGQWFGFSDAKNQIYENLIILNSQYTKPTEQEIEAKRVELENEAQAKIDAKVSGNQKLLDLGLTQAEATALTGYTPPSED